MKAFFSMMMIWGTVSFCYGQSANEFLDLGREKIKLNNFGDAITDFSKVLEIDPLNSDALFLRGTLKLILDDYSGAYSDLSTSLDIKSKKESNQKSNEEPMDKAKMVMRNNSCLFCHLGYSKAKLDEPAEAISWFDKAAEADPKRGETFYRRGLVKLLVGQRVEACLDFGKATELGYKAATAASNNYCR
jgi:tetratricopeptide (TPR) repeat protein